MHVGHDAGKSDRNLGVGDRQALKSTEGLLGLKDGEHARRRKEGSDRCLIEPFDSVRGVEIVLSDDDVLIPRQPVGQTKAFVEHALR